MLGVRGLCRVYTDKVLVWLVEDDTRSRGGRAWIGTRETGGSSGGGGRNGGGSEGRRNGLSWIGWILVRVVSALWVVGVVGVLLGHLLELELEVGR